MKKLAVLSVLFVSPAASSEQTHFPAFVDGNELWKYCDNVVDGRRNPACYGYTMGVVDGIMYWTEPTETLCLDKIDRVQIVDLLVRRLSEHPETRHHGAASLVYSAIKDSFPCAPSSTP
jgi:hypothetical protein